MNRLLALALLLTACGGGPRARVASAVDTGDFDEAYDAYEAFRQTEGEDDDLLARVATTLLREEALGDDEERSRAAIAQLALAGTAGESTLVRIAESPGVTPGRLGALVRLAQRGRTDARLSLRALADRTEPEVLAAAIVGMDPARDLGLLLEHLEAEDARVRAAAASALAPRAAEEGVAHALAERARIDAEASVRAAAVRALAGGGDEAVGPLRERLGDPEASVRLAAVGALYAADRAAALEALGPLLEVAPSPSGVEAARLIAQLGAQDEASSEAAAARAFLVRVLAGADPSLRSMAGVALAGLPVDAAAPLDAVREALAREADAAARLSLARALWRRDREVAEAALVGLLDAEEAMPRIQAAAILAPEGEARAESVLAAALADEGAASIVRRTAVRALAREAMRPARARGALRDSDALVRIYAAGGILAAAAARI